MDLGLVHSRVRQSTVLSPMAIVEIPKHIQTLSGCHAIYPVISRQRLYVPIIFDVLTIAFVKLPLFEFHLSRAPVYFQLKITVLM